MKERRMSQGGYSKNTWRGVRRIFWVQNLHPRYFLGSRDLSRIFLGLKKIRVFFWVLGLVYFFGFAIRSSVGPPPSCILQVYFKRMYLTHFLKYCVWMTFSTATKANTSKLQFHLKLWIKSHSGDATTNFSFLFNHFFLISWDTILFLSIPAWKQKRSTTN